MDQYGPTHYGMVPMCKAPQVSGRSVVSSVRVDHVTCLTCKGLISLAAEAVAAERATRAHGPDVTER